MNSGVLDPKHQDEKRKKKEERRRDVKQQRKQRLTEKSNQAILAKHGNKAEVADPQKAKEQKIKQQQDAANKDLLTDELMNELVFADKIGLVSNLRDSLISFPTYRYRQLKDLLKLCTDSNPDVVLKATTALCDVFCDILPSYRIRQLDDEAPKEKVSKDVEQLRNQEQSVLESYKDYL